MKRISGGQPSLGANATLLSSHAGGPRAATGDRSFAGQTRQSTRQSRVSPPPAREPTGRVGRHRPDDDHSDSDGSLVHRPALRRLGSRQVPSHHRRSRAERQCSGSSERLLSWTTSTRLVVGRETAASPGRCESRCSSKSVSRCSSAASGGKASAAAGAIQCLPTFARMTASKRRGTHIARRGRSLGSTVRSCHAAPMQSRKQASAGSTRDESFATRARTSRGRS